MALIIVSRIYFHIFPSPTPKALEFIFLRKWEEKVRAIFFSMDASIKSLTIDGSCE
jgi:hypothetical protein